MAIDLHKEAGLDPTQAAPYFGSSRSSKPCHPSKVVRLITRGVLLPDGTRLRLEALRLGCKWVTTVQAITEFGQRLAAARLGGSDQGTVRDTKARRKADLASLERRFSRGE
jgi:hypothetical protein